MNRTLFVCLILTIMTSGCAGHYRPLVDTKGKDMSRYEIDLVECRAYAEQVAGVGTGAVVGAVLGAAFGAVISKAAGSRYDAGAGARVGAVAGGAGGAGAGAQQEIGVVRNCMIGRGYRVLN